MSILEVDGISLSFNQKRILSDIYLKCETGDILALIGSNGSGKSSLLEIIFGSLNGESKSVRIDGKFQSKPFSVPNSIHFVPQNGMFMNYLTFQDIAKIFKLKHNLNQIYEIEEINKYSKTPFGQLSVGIKKLMEVIVLLYAKSRFILLDEPFTYLSPILEETLIQHIKLRAKNKGIILTDHRYKVVWPVANKHYVLYDGITKRIHYMKELRSYGYIN